MSNGNMNTYKKFAANVFVAECDAPHGKGEIITLTTKHGAEHDCIVHNLVAQRGDVYYYSITRADGFNAQERMKRKAERFEAAASNSQRKSDQYWNASNEGRDWLALGEPIKIGHHSERRHMALIERNHNRMSNAVAFSDKADEQQRKADYYRSMENVINLSMPESIEFYEYKLEEAKAYHEGLKSGQIKREHSYSLPYAKKAVNEAEKNLELAKRLWA